MYDHVIFGFWFLNVMQVLGDIETCHLELAMHVPFSWSYGILFTHHIYNRLRISSTTSVVKAVPPKSGLKNLPSSKLASTAA